MTRCVLATLVGLVVITAARDAHALKPRAHADITLAACKATGLPKSFCTRVATENYNTDAREWEDLAAHAQIGDGSTACQAADAAVGRVWLRATELHDQLAKIRAGARSDQDIGVAGRALGRLLHTVQDQCAHRGMPNPQHAWFSLSDFCDNTTLSPDIQDDALVCARAETEAIMASVAAAVRSNGVAQPLADHSCPEDPFGNDRNQSPPLCERRFLPSLFDACDFFGEAEHWDGIDRQWDGAVVARAMRGVAASGLTGLGIGGSVCGGNESVLSPAVSQPIVDTSPGTPSCTRAHVICFGKADDDGDIENPFDDPEPEAGGCSTGGGPNGGGALALVLLALSRRRRRAI